MNSIHSAQIQFSAAIGHLTDSILRTLLYPGFIDGPAVDGIPKCLATSVGSSHTFAGVRHMARTHRPVTKPLRGHYRIAPESQEPAPARALHPDIQRPE